MKKLQKRERKRKREREKSRFIYFLLVLNIPEFLCFCFRPTRYCATIYEQAGDLGRQVINHLKVFSVHVRGFGDNGPNERPKAIWNPSRPSLYLRLAVPPTFSKTDTKKKCHTEERNVVFLYSRQRLIQFRGHTTTKKKCFREWHTEK